jgi:hypothetical protein
LVGLAFNSQLGERLVRNSLDTYHFIDTFSDPILFDNEKGIRHEFYEKLNKNPGNK